MTAIPGGHVFLRKKRRFLSKPALSVSKKSFRHAEPSFLNLEKFKKLFD